MQIALKIVGLIISLIGVVMVYDARILTHKYFGFGDQNEATLGIKMLGFLFAIIGGLLIFFNI